MADFFTRVRLSIKKRGVPGMIQRGLQTIIGVNQWEEEIDTLFYLLNSSINITKIGPTKDIALRNTQLCMLELLNVIDAMCEKYKMRYWLDFGTLLGAIRHNGFIPWDDDLDISMPRDDYNKVMELWKDELEQYGIIVMSGGYFDDNSSLARLGIAYKTLETGAWIDIFPVDFGKCDKYNEQTVADVEACMSAYRKFYRKNIKKLPLNELWSNRQQYFTRLEEGEKKIIYHGQEWQHRGGYVILPEEDVLPTIKHPFENYFFPVPCSYDKYLTQIYGRNYMDFPRRGIEHHKDPDGGYVKDRAIKHGIDLVQEKAYLKSVAEKIRLI